MVQTRGVVRMARGLGRLVMLWCSVACAPADKTETTNSAGTIAWAQLRNPVLGFPDVAIKDAFAVFHDGRWHLGYSHLTEEPFRFRLGFSSTPDWLTFEHGELMDDPDLGGLASPTVVRAPDGRFVMTYNSHTRDLGDASNKLYYRTSNDMQTWSEPTRIHIEGADNPEDRLIDVALAFTEHGIFLFFKLEQIAQVAHSPSGSLDGPWNLVGSLSHINLENMQAINIDGTWHLLATVLVVHRPVLFRLDGDPSDPQAWRDWTEVGELEIPEQSWNTGDHPLAYERANAGYLIDERAVDGHFYLLYAGSTEVVRFSGRGYSRLALARSPDLRVWEVPPEQ